MLSQSIARTARTSCAHNTNPLATAATRHVPSTPQIAAAATASGGGCLARQSAGRGHQRRPSSSSASSPPNGQRPPASSSEEDPASIARDKENRKVRLLRRKLREANDALLAKATDAAAAKEQAFANVPAVPSTGHLQLADVKVSSFFALHRPMSVTSTFPPSSADSTSFDTIFQPPKHRPNDVIYTLSNAAAALESRLQSSSSSPTSNNNDLNWQTVQQDGTTVSHLDLASPQSIEQMIKNFRPFNPPPPPVSFDQKQTSPPQRRVTHDRLDEYRQRQLNAVLEQPSATSSDSTATSLATSTTAQSQHKQRQRALTGATPAAAPSEGASSPSVRWSRQKLAMAAAERVVGRHERREMLLISVKRQRKLKMKKHKYKKLMRKTRNLRIREGRN